MGQARRESSSLRDDPKPNPSGFRTSCPVLTSLIPKPLESREWNWGSQDRVENVLVDEATAGHLDILKIHTINL